MCVKCSKDVGYLKFYEAYIGQKYPSAKYECLSCKEPVLDAFEDKSILASYAMVSQGEDDQIKKP
jgi:hypothetical protein